MSLKLIVQPYGVILDPKAGGGRAKPVANGRYYVGVVNLDPVSNPNEDLVYRDESGAEIPLTSPLILNNSGAFVVSENDGSLIQPYIKSDDDYSVLITDKNGSSIYSANSASGIPCGGGGGSGVHNDLSGRGAANAHPASSVAMSNGETVEDLLNLTFVLAI